MTVHSRYVRGALAYYEGHLRRLVDAVGENVQKFELKPEHAGQHAGATGSNPPAFTMTVVEIGTGTSEVEASNEIGVVWELINAADDNDGINIQLIGELFKADGNRDLYFGVKFEASEETQIDWMFGLCITDTTLLGGVADGIYFETLDGGTGISVVTEKNGTETQTDALGTAVADTGMVLEFYYAAAEDSVYFFIDGVEVAIHTANIPDDQALRVSIAELNGEGTAHRVKINWLRVIQIS